MAHKHEFTTKEFVDISSKGDILEHPYYRLICKCGKKRIVPNV